MKHLAILALAVLIALPANAAGVTISGYIDFGYIAGEPGTSFGSTASRLQASGATNGNFDRDDGFALNEVNLDLSSQLTNDISAFASIDFASTADAGNVDGTGMFGNIDYAYVDFANPGPFDLNVRAGRIPSVMGIEQRVSESNQQKFINLSLTSPYLVGAVDGVAIYGSFSPVNYAVAVANSDIMGPGGQVGPQGAGAANIAMIEAPGNDNAVANANSNDNNNDLAVMGRIGVVPIEGLELGISGSYDQWNAGGTAARPQNLQRTILSADASYVWGALTLKGEYMALTEEQNAIALAQGDIKVQGYYVEGVYDLNSKWSFGGRYSNMRQSQSGVTAATTGSQRINEFYTVSAVGLYRIADNVVLKGEYDLNRERVLDRQSATNTVGYTKPQTNNDVFALSLVGSF